MKLQTLKGYKKQLKNYQQELYDLNAEIQSIQKIVDRYNQTKQQLDLKTHEVTLLEQQINGSSNSQVTAACKKLKQPFGYKLYINIKHSLYQIIHIVDNIKSQIAEHENIIVVSSENRKAALDSCQRIEDEMNEFKNNRDSKLKDIEVNNRVEKK